MPALHLFHDDTKLARSLALLHSAGFSHDMGKDMGINKLPGLSAALLVSSAAMAAPTWTPMTESADFKASAKLNSFRVVNTQGGDEVALVTTQIVSKKKNSTLVLQHYIKTDDCIREQGKVVVLDMDGKFMTENSFAFGAGNNDSVVAEFICNLYIKNRKGL